MLRFRFRKQNTVVQDLLLMVEIVYGLAGVVMLVGLLSSLMLKRTHDGQKTMTQQPGSVNGVLNSSEAASQQ